LTTKLLTSYKQKIEDLHLIPSDGGCFELSINGDLIYSKLQSGRFPDEKWVLDTIGARLK
jgi:selenoprotein W-related protein